MKYYLFTIILFGIGLYASHNFSHDAKVYADTTFDITVQYNADTARKITELENEIQIIKSENTDIAEIERIKKIIYSEQLEESIKIMRESKVFLEPLVVSSISVNGAIAKLTVFFGECDGCVTDVTVDLKSKTFQYE